MSKVSKKFYLFAIESTRFCLDVLREPSTLSAARHRPSAFCQRREWDFEEVVHALDVLHEEVELQLEHFKAVLQHGTVVRLAEGDQVELKQKRKLKFINFVIESRNYEHWFGFKLTHCLKVARGALSLPLSPLPLGLIVTCSSTADLICGWTKSGSIFWYPWTRTTPRVVGSRRRPDPTVT